MASPKIFKTRADDFVSLVRDNFRAKSKKLRIQFEQEINANQHSFESGGPLEDFFREQLAELFPAPYGVGAGKIVDHEQYTCGCDFIIYDPHLAPLLKPPASKDSRRKFFAFETTYGVVEVKQTLTLGATSDAKLKDNPSGTLYEACTKVFQYKQLHRNPPGPVTWGINHPIGSIFFYDCKLDLNAAEQVELLLHEFKMINSLVAPEHRVNALYVLDQFSVHWTFTETSDSKTFLNLQHPVEIPSARPLWLSLSRSGPDTLYRMFTHLWSTLGRTQLAAPDLLNEYGGRKFLLGDKLKCVPVTVGASMELAAMMSSAASEGGDPG